MAISASLPASFPGLSALFGKLKNKGGGVSSFSIKRTPDTVLGLDFGATSIRAVLLGKRAEGIEILRFAEKEILPRRQDSHDEATLRALESLYSENGFSKDEAVVASFSSEFVSFRPVSFPFAGRKKIEAALPFELEKSLPYPVETGVVSFLSCSSSQNETRLVGCCTKKHRIAALLSLLAEGGVSPLSLIPDSCALASTLVNQGGEGTGAVLLVDVGAKKTSFSLAKDGVLVDLATIGWGLGDASAPQSRLDYFSQVKRAVLSLKKRTGISPEALLLAGGGAKSQEIKDAIMDMTGLVPEPWSPLLGPYLLKERRAIEGVFFPSYAVAFGLALTGLDKGAASSDLRRGEFAYTPRFNEESENFLKRIAVYASVLLLLFSVSLYVEKSGKEREYNEISERLRNDYLLLAPKEGNIVNERAQLTVKMQEMEGQYQSLVKFSGIRGLFLDTLREISVNMPKGKTEISLLSFDTETVHIEGTTDSFESVDRVKMGLQNSPSVASVRIENMHLMPDKSRVSFNAFVQLKLFSS